MRERLLHRGGWLFGGALLAILVAQVGAAAPDPALQGRLLERSDGALFVYKDGAKYSVQPADLGDDAINAIPDGSPAQLDRLFGPVPPVVVPVGKRLEVQSSPQSLKSLLGKVEVSLDSVEPTGAATMTWHVSLWNHNADSLQVLITRFDIANSATPYLVAPDGRRYPVQADAPATVYPEERKTVDLQFAASPQPGSRYQFYLKTAVAPGILVPELVLWSPVDVSL